VDTNASVVDRFIARLVDESPPLGTFAGHPATDHRRLPDLSAGAVARREAADDADAAALDVLDTHDALDEAELGTAGRVDRDLLRAELRGRAIGSEWAEWRRSPDDYLSAGLMGCFALFLRRPLPEPELVAAAADRLRGVPATVEAMVANLDPDLAAPSLVRRGVGQARAGVAYARELLPAEVADDDLRAELSAAGEVAAVAYEKAAQHLEDLATRATGGFALGEARYSALLTEKELLPHDAAGLQAVGEAQVETLSAEMRAVAERGFGTDDFRAVLRDLTRRRPTTPEEMREGYERCTAEARAFLVARDLVTLPDGERCQVLPSPVFQRPVLAVASYFPPPAFGDSLDGIFNVPYPPEGTTPEQLAERLTDNSFPSMPTTTVHEVYPGHHWHFARLQVTASPLRRVVTTSYFTEGWALYAERMMREQGFFTDPGDELAHLDARLFRAARIVVDTGLHCFDLTGDDAVDYMAEVAGLPRAVAEAEVTRYCAWPTQAASYLTGSLLIEALRDRWQAEGRGDLKAFHDAVAGTGAMPVALAERALHDAP
jgi:uncharacterized protein (DUF885 family)